MSSIECRYCRDTDAKSSCGHCGLVHYCGRACQAKDWKSHKADCKTTMPKMKPAETWEDLPKVSVSKLIGTKEEQASEFARLTFILTTYGCLILNDLPDFASEFYHDFKEGSQAKMSAKFFDSRKTNREIEPRSFVYSSVSIPFSSKSRRFQVHVLSLLEHLVFTLQLIFGTEDIKRDSTLRMDGALTFMKSVPKRTIRQPSHFDGSILSAIIPVPSVQTTLPSSSKDCALSSFECFHPERKCFQKIAVKEGEMILIAGREIAPVTRQWIQPCAHRVVTEPGHQDRLSLVCTPRNIEENGKRREMDLGILNVVRIASVPPEMKMRLEPDAKIWNESVSRVQKYEWLLPTSVDKSCDFCIVDIMAEEGDENPYVIDIDDVPRPKRK